MSLIDLKEIHQQIKSKLFEISYVVDGFNKCGDNDLSRYAEIYFKNILNIVYKQKNIKLEKIERINQDTFDLIDVKNKICFQITSNKRKDKRIKTHTSFKKKYENKIGEIFVLIITKDNYSKLDAKEEWYNELNIIELISIIENNCIQKDLIEIRDILFNSFRSESKPIKVNKKSANSNKNISIKEFNRIRILEKKLSKELVYKDYYKNFTQEQLYDSPFEKFKDMRFILRAFDDSEYPEVNEESKWSRTFLYDFYKNGLLVWLSACIGINVIYNIKTEIWFEEERYTNYLLKENEIRIEQARIIGKLPYKNILDFHDGDEYYSDYHIFCKYEGIENSPFEDIVYIIKNKYGFWVELNNEKKKKTNT